MKAPPTHRRHEARDHERSRHAEDTTAELSGGFIWYLLTREMQQFRPPSLLARYTYVIACLTTVISANTYIEMRAKYIHIYVREEIINSDRQVLQV